MNSQILIALGQAIFVMVFGWFTFDLLCHSTSYGYFLFNLFGGFFHTIFVTDPAPIVIIEDRVLQLTKIQ